MISFNFTLLDALLGLLVLIVFDWIFGILAAFRTNTFTLAYLYHQGEAQALAFGFALALWALDSIDIGHQAVASGALGGLFIAYSAAYAAKMALDIIAKVGVVASGGGAQPQPAPAQPIPPAA